MILESMKCLLGNRKQFHFGWKLRGQEIEYQKGIIVFKKISTRFCTNKCETAIHRHMHTFQNVHSL